MRRHSLARTIGAALSPAGARSRLVVFCYHQVLDTIDPLRPGEPDASQFRSDVEVIDRLFNVLPFSEAVAKLKSGDLPGRAACITFDDGYANNHSRAAPILKSVGVPATFFIAAGAVDAGIMWNDLVIESVAQSGDDTDAAQLAATLGELKYQPMQERWRAAVDMYRRAVGSELPRLMMTRDMVADLASQGFEIGGHTINHPILQELSDADANSEIAGCAAWIATVTGSAPTSFAYPNGVPNRDYSGKHSAMVSDAGFQAAASTEWALARSSSDALNIPRVGPWWRQGRAVTAGLLRSYLKSYVA